MKRSWIETFSESLGLIPKISDRPDWSEEFAMEGPRELYKYPDPSEWDDFTELAEYGINNAADLKSARNLFAGRQEVGAGVVTDIVE